LVSLAICRGAVHEANSIGARLSLSWKRRFDDAIVLPDGCKLVTLLDAAIDATKLPKKEVDSVEWRAAIESLMLVAELSEGPASPREGPLQ
jgi:hypothetical protein